MLHKHRKWKLVTLGLLGVVWLGRGAVIEAQRPSATQPTIRPAAPAKAQSATPTPDETQSAILKADIARALQLLKDDQLETLIEDYYPVEAVRTLRKRKAIGNTASDLRRSKAILRRWEDRLTRSLSGRFEGNNDEAFAYPAPPSAAAPNAPSQPVQSAVTLPELPGYGDDLTVVLKAAIADLKAKQYETFLTHMLPVAEVVRLQEDQQLAFTASQFELHSELAPTMLADLETMLKGKLAITGDIASGELPGRSPGEKPRAVRLQRTGGSWRFFDQAAETREAIEQVKQRGSQMAADPAAFDPLLKFERIRDHWRLVELP
ncbi:MAG: hypothetical protein DWH91_09855 [Planctomycetota bacterium]|nr:MAG: hypothetical protein DWH91_09855 [Planctomycetota bacterium]